MALSARLQQKQSQSLSMTPQLAQSIKLLQLNSQELMDFVQAEIEKNPLLEIDHDPDAKITENRQEIKDDSPLSKEISDTPTEITNVVSDEMTLGATANEQNLETSFDNVYDSGKSEVDKIKDKERDRAAKSDTLLSSGATENLDYAAMMGEKQSLPQYLDGQIACTFGDDKQRKIATYIAHALNEDGYFKDDLEETAKLNNCTLEELNAVLEKFQTLEPVGVGARDLSECLKIQLLDKNHFDPAMEVLINNLELLAKREFAKLIKLCEVSREDFADMIAEIKALDPRPARQYDSSVAENIIADVIIKQKEDGNWAIELNNETLPKVLVNREYHAELQSKVDTDDGKKFIVDCLSNATWLTKSLDQRAQTILKVATEIVAQQDMFFAEGVEHLRPLNLKVVAEAIKMHESTISRVTTKKYIQCERGIFEFKYFFSSALSNGDEDGDDHSSQSVKHRIRQLIDGEDPKKILSDDRLVSMLQDEGITIARRTIAKYREAMHIPSSVQRRREKNSLL